MCRQWHKLMQRSCRSLARSPSNPSLRRSWRNCDSRLECNYNATIMAFSFVAVSCSTTASRCLRSTEGQQALERSAPDEAVSAPFCAFHSVEKKGTKRETHVTTAEARGLCGYDTS